MPNDATAMSMLQEIATKSERLLDGLEEAQSGVTAIEGYRAAIQRIGLTWGSRLDYAALSLSFSDVMKPVLPFFNFLLASDGYPSWWMQSFLSGGGLLSSRPFLHLLVEQWLTRANAINEDDGRLKALRVARSTTKGRGRVAEWRTGSHDARVLGQVPEAAQRIRSRVPLARVTRNGLARELGISTLAKTVSATRAWPLTSQAITANEETSEAFFRRRLQCEIEKVAAEGKEPRVHLLLKRLGRRDRHDDVADAIAEWKARPGTSS